MQCTCNSLFAICYSTVKRVSVWKSWDLDYILESGNDIFKNINIFRPLSVDELPNTLTIGSQLISIEMLTYYSELLDKTDIFEVHKSLTSDSNGLIFTTGGYSISLIWNKSKVFYLILIVEITTVCLFVMVHQSS